MRFDGFLEGKCLGGLVPPFFYARALKTAVCNVLNRPYSLGMRSVVIM
jgi:hypothetical protein